MSNGPELYAIVPAGGAGTRLWPLSRAKNPKFLLDITGSGRTLLQQTADRLEPLTGKNGLKIVTGRAHRAAVHQQLPGVEILAEPSPRDSMAAIGLAAAILHRRHGDSMIGSFAADHVIKDDGAFHAAVREAIEVAKTGQIVTLGIDPLYPSTAYGYIRCGQGVPGAKTALQVLAFEEKPGPQTAAEYLRSGNYRWNAGMFVARTGVLLDALNREHPALATGLDEIAQAWDTGGRAEALAWAWTSLQKISIDHAIAEPAAARGAVSVVPVDMGWSDLGDFDSLAPHLEQLEGTSTGYIGDPRTIISLESENAIIVNGGTKTVTLLGIDGAVVVETPDALLVTTRQKAQDVKEIVDLLRGSGRNHLL